MPKVNLREKLSYINDYWKPVVVGELNKQQVKLVKVKGRFVMHHHEQEDELFLVLKGKLTMDYGSHTETINEGEFVIVRAGTDHCPFAEEEAHLLLFEPETVLNTGNQKNDLTHEKLEKI